MIVIGDDWGIQADSNQYAVFRKRHNKKTGEDIWGPVTYHTSLPEAVKSLVRRIDRLSLVDKDMTLSEAIHKLEDNHMKFKVLIEEAFPNIEVKLK